MPRILLIDDDAQLGPPLKTYFERFGLTLVHAHTPSAGLALLRGQAQPAAKAGGGASEGSLAGAGAEGGFDAAILDVMLPEMDGFALCRTIRAQSDLPIVMLTARGDVMDRVVGLELGADDYLPKPFEPRELVARIQTVLRRRVSPAAGATTFGRPDANGLLAPVAQAAPELRFEGLVIDPVRRSVQRQGEPVELTGTEFELLLLLAREPGRVFSRDDILNQLRGHEADLYTRAVDIVVSRLRKKLEPLDAVKTLRNAGYSLALRPVAAGGAA